MMDQQGRRHPTGSAWRRGRYATALIGSLIVAGPWAEASPPQAELAISNARVMTGTGEVLDDVRVVISGGRIVSVGRPENESPAGTHIDGRGQTLLPGLIDAHVHILLGREVRDEASLSRHVRDLLPAVLEGFLSHGVTTIRSVGDHWPQILEIRRELQEGTMRGPRLLIAGPVLTAPGGHPASTVCRDNEFCRTHLAAEVSTEQQARETVRELAEARVDAIKLVVDDFERFSRLLPQLPFDVVGAILDEAHQHGLPVVGHIIHAGTARQAFLLGLDGLVHPPVAGEEEFESLVALLREQPRPVVSTLTLGASRDAVRKKMVRDLHLAGVPIVAGTDYVASGPGQSEDWAAGSRTIREMALLVEAGLSTRAAIRAATRDAAAHLGILHETGTVEVGKSADLILVPGDPEKDITTLGNPSLVLQAGRIVVDRRQP